MTFNLKHLKSTAAAALLALAPASAFAEDWKFAIEEIPGSIMDAYAQEFKSRIEAATNGDVTVTVYPMGTLGTPTETVEQAADGIINFTNVSIGNLGTIVPESQVFLLPYLLPSDPAAISDILSGSETIYGELNNDFRQRGLEVMTMYSEGPQVWTTNREIRSPEDFENFKMRVMVSPILVETYNNMGASPTPLPFGEVFGALQLGAIDGQVNPIPTIEEMKFYEVTSHLIWAGEQELVTTVVAGSDWFETLSADRQELVRSTMADMTAFIDGVVTDFNQARLDTIREAKPDISLVVLTEEERDVFRARSGDTAAAYVDTAGDRGQQLLDALNAELATN
ncbi:TRAP transporter substrate-binding protein [Halocynthiibacter styelae]|uniref:TRAP transporter substrate-binding protein DctP n=1 Tax=Halocynthiibacter styelae TaxID=2761955 RepID=A0A8J7J502_9RHOB|nr:TRAP transporter substrate-binding protein DctP [Paenihalocynthiibacter styelae]MBI1493455.1 TRAP transporter substrate-binding protein DctP [Paenihalocynthiibacter styelae]